jgi:hypothetical protein
LSKKIEPIQANDNVIDNIAKLKPEIILFQAGYLTIKGRLPNPGGLASYALDFPNLEVASCMVPLLYSLDPIKNPLNAKREAERALSALKRMDAAEFGEAFGNYLGMFSYDLHDNKENYYHTLFLALLHLANQNFMAQGHRSMGMYDLHLVSGGDDYIVEFKVLRSRGKNPYEMPKTDKDKATLTRRMGLLAAGAINQISLKYAQPFLGGPGRLIKVGLVVAKRSHVVAKFEVVEPKPFRP